MAAAVAVQVDAFISGRPRDYPASGTILVFGNTPTMQVQLHHGGPITLRGPKILGEPDTTVGGITRIAVTPMDALYLRRFVYQLAHELAHVKMGGAIDNSLLETFATSVSLEVLKRMGLNDYLIPNVQQMIRSLPPNVQEQIANGDFAALQTYWQEQCGQRWHVMDDRPVQYLGTILLQVRNQYFWPLLLNVGELSIGRNDQNLPTILLPPDISAMQKKGIDLTALGYSPLKR